MGNVFSKKRYCRIDAKTLEETPFSYYTEVSSDLRDTRIEYVTDETLGNASNLLKSEDPSTNFGSIEEEFRDGWIVKRHVEVASVIIALCEATSIFGFDINTTGFENICPSHACIEGLKSSIEDIEEWITLVNTEEIYGNCHNFFQKNYNEEILFSHIRLTVSPGGGIARFRTYGDIVPGFLEPEEEYNLASASLGARIVRWSDTIHSNKPNVLFDNGTLTTDGWLTPRSREKNRNDFIVIQLASPGLLNSVVIDTTGFNGNSPLKVRVEACNSKEDDPYFDVYTQWISLVAESHVRDNELNTFQVSHIDVVTHVRLTLIPDGGVQQIKCIGTVSKDLDIDSIEESPNANLCLKESLSTNDLSNQKQNNQSNEAVNSSMETSNAINIDELPIVSFLDICNNNLMAPPQELSVSSNDQDLYQDDSFYDAQGPTQSVAFSNIQDLNESISSSNTQDMNQNDSFYVTQRPIRSGSFYNAKDNESVSSSNTQDLNENISSSNAQYLNESTSSPNAQYINQSISSLIAQDMNQDDSSSESQEYTQSLSFSNAQDVDKSTSSSNTQDTNQNDSFYVPQRPIRSVSFYNAQDIESISSANSQDLNENISSHNTQGTNQNDSSYVTQRLTRSVSFYNAQDLDQNTSSPNTQDTNQNDSSYVTESFVPKTEEPMEVTEESKGVKRKTSDLDDLSFSPSKKDSSSRLPHQCT